MSVSLPVKVLVEYVSSTSIYMKRTVDGKEFAWKVAVHGYNENVAMVYGHGEIFLERDYNNWSGLSVDFNHETKVIWATDSGLSELLYKGLITSDEREAYRKVGLPFMGTGSVPEGSELIEEEDAKRLLRCLMLGCELSSFTEKTAKEQLFGEGPTGPTHFTLRFPDSRDVVIMENDNGLPAVDEDASDALCDFLHRRGIDPFDV